MASRWLRLLPAPAQERGQAATEYMLIVVFFVGIVIAFHDRLKTIVLGWFNWIAQHIAGPVV